MSRARELANLGRGDALFVNNSNNFVGVGSTTPDRKLDIGTGDLIVGAAITLGGASGVISATAYHGDGSNLEGVASAGLGTALGSVEGRGDDVIYYTNKVLNINDDTTITVPDSADVAYTQYTDIVVADSKDLIVSESDELVPDVLGLSTEGVTALTGSGGRVRAGSITNKAGSGAPDFTNGWTAAGISTVTDSTSSTSTTTGALVVSGGVGIAKSLFVGEGISVAGTITYNDVTNIDSIGIVTAGAGLYVGRGAGVALTITEAGYVQASGIVTAIGGLKIGPSAGIAATIYTDGAVSTVGIITASQLHAVNNASVGIVSCSTGADLNGYKVEEGKYDTDALNGEFDFLLENGHIQTHTGSTAGTFFPDFKVSSGTSLNSVMDVGDVISCTLFVAASNTAHYCTTGIKIDDSTSNLTIEWIGSAAPTAGKGAGYDIYAFTIQKTAATPAYLIIVNATDAG